MAEVEPLAAGDVHAVDEDRCVVFPVLHGRRGNTANDRHRKKLTQQTREGQTGSEVRHIVQILDTRRLDFRRAEGGNRKRHILQPLLHPACRDDDFLERNGAFLSARYPGNP